MGERRARHPADVGSDQPTNQSAVIVGDKVELRRDLKGDDDGDSTVPRVSAAIARTQGGATYTPERHASIQNFDTVLVHLKGVVRALYGSDIEDFRAVHDVWFSVDLDDVYASEEPVVVDVAMRALAGESALPDGPVSLRSPTGTPARCGPARRSGRHARQPRSTWACCPAGPTSSTSPGRARPPAAGRLRRLRRGRSRY